MKPDKDPITPKGSNNKLIIFIVIINAIISLILFGLLYDIINRNEIDINQAIQSYVKSIPPVSVLGADGPKGPQGEVGISGYKGDQGDKGESGPEGKEGLQGQPGTPGERGETGATGSQGEVGAQGPAGPTGPMGQSPQFRCNPETGQNEYKYPADEDWTQIGSVCIPTAQ